MEFIALLRIIDVVVMNEAATVDSPRSDLLGFARVYSTRRISLVAKAAP